MSINRPKASQFDREEHQTPPAGGEDENRYRGGGEIAETSEALPLVKTHSDTEQDWLSGIVST